MKLHRKPLFVACAGVLLAATTPLPAFAQGGAGLEEIIVTAQRHEESLQETPIAITAFSARDLENQRVTNIMHLLNKVPSLALAPWAGSRVTPNLSFAAWVT
jgi:iron complex outermembrane receptor protein